MWRIRKLFKPNQTKTIDRNRLKQQALKMLSKRYTLLADIGSGSFGDVVALWGMYSHRAVAAKIMHCDMTSENELKLWPNFKHPNVVPVLDLIRGQEVNIFLMPHYPYTLLDILEDSNYRYNPNSFRVTLDWMNDILTGVAYLHRSDVCHLDLKSDNVLITPENSAVISDFSTLDVATKLTDKYALPRYYCPPEAWPLQIDDPLPKVDGKAFDIWSIGMILYYIFSDRWMELHLWGRTCWWDEIYPIASKSMEFSFFNRLIRRAFPLAEIDAAIASEALNLVKGVLRYKPEQRPEASVILRHVLLSEKHDDLLEPDLIWTCNPKDVQRQVIKGKIGVILNTATDHLRRKHEKCKCKDNTLKDYYDEVTTKLQIWQWCCSSCCREKDSEEPVQKMNNSVSKD